MNTLRFVVISAGVLAAATAMLVACGDDDVVLAVPDGGADAQQPDANNTQPLDSGADAKNDLTDSGDNDSGNNLDAGDSGPTFFDASTYDAGPDAGFAPDAGQATVQLADVFCGTVSRCCFGSDLKQGDALPGGGTYNRNLCLSDYQANGYEQASQGTTVNPSHIIVDQTGSQACAQKLQAMSCNLGGAEFDAIRAACYGALLGTQGPGESCNVAAECQKGLFCNNPDGGVGACALVRATGQTCGDVTTDINDAQHICSYRYSGDPSRYCQTYDFANSKFLPQAQWTCQDDVANGSKCLHSGWCQNGLCDTTHTCVAQTTYFSTSNCNRYKQ